MSRSRSVLSVLMAFASLSLLLAACGAPATDQAAQPSASAGAASAAPASGGASSAQETLVFAADLSDQISMDPAAVYEFGGIQVVGNIYETLVSFTPGDPALKPLLATQWDIQDSGDQWTITFKLNEQAKFATGRAVTADDVIYSWGRAIDLNKSPAFLLIDIAQLKKENMRAVDPQTVEVKLPKSASPQVFLSILSFTIGAVLDKETVMANAGEDMGSTWLNDHSAGSGPYVLDSWERSTQNVLTANPNYWGQAPAIKRVIMRNVGEAANLQSAIETGDADIVQDLGAEQVAALGSNPDVQIVKAPSSTLVYLGMNAKSAPLDNPDVREAIRYAINYDEIVNNLLGGNAQVVQEVIPAGLFGHTGAKPFSQDIAKAKDLIAKAGVAEGTEIELLVTAAANAPGGVEWGTLAAKLQSDLQQIGLKINIKAIQQSELLTIYRAQDAQMVLILWGPDFPDPDGNVTPFTNYAANSIAWRNDWEAPADLTQIGQQAALEQDSAKRAELYKQLTERVLHEGPYAILYQPTRTFGVRKNVQNFAYDAADTPAVSFWLLNKN
ncbi:MAG: ABC transporter substrate-binding protein [Chloroflexi bacterium]|nr:ABC transporter substrate-binding protein [Chloroflexota bacterium]